MKAFGRLAALVGLAAAADSALAGVANLTHCPLALDSVGAGLAGALGGPLVGPIAGIVSGATVAWIVPGGGPLWAAALTHGLVGLAAALASRTGALRRPGASLAAGAATGLAVAIVLILGGAAAASAPVAAFLLGRGWGPTLALTGLGVAVEVVDKALTFLVLSLVAGRRSRSMPVAGASGLPSGGDRDVAQVSGDS